MDPLLGSMLVERGVLVFVSGWSRDSRFNGTSGLGPAGFDLPNAWEPFPASSPTASFRNRPPRRAHFAVLFEHHPT